jgi:hypothetical protein
MLSLTLNNGLLQVNCDTRTELQGGNQIFLGLDSSGNGNIFAAITDHLGNLESGSFDPSTLSQIFLDGCAAGSDTFTIAQTLASTHTTVNFFANSGGPNDVVNFPSGAFGLSSIQGTVDIYDPNGSVAVNVIDTTSFGINTTYLFNFTYPDDPRLLGAIRGPAPADIHYDYAQTSKVSIVTSALLVGPTVNVEATGTTTNLVLNGDTAVNVTENGSLQEIQGTLNIENPSSPNRRTALFIDGSADPPSLNINSGTFTPNPDDSEMNSDTWQYIHGWAPAAINYECQDISRVTEAFADGVLTQFRASCGPAEIIGHGMMTVHVGDAGSVQGIRGALYIDNTMPGGTTLDVDDSADPVARTVTLASVVPAAGGPTFGSITGLAPASITYDFAALAIETIATGIQAGNEINVLATGVPTDLDLNSIGTVNVGLGNGQRIMAPLNIMDSQPAAATVNVDDSADTALHTVTLTSASSTPAASMDLVSSSWGVINGLAPAPIAYQYAGTSSITLATSNALSDVINVLGTGVPTDVYPFNGAEINVGNGSVAGIQGPLGFWTHNSKIINVDDSADPAQERAIIEPFTPPGSELLGSVVFPVFRNGPPPARVMWTIPGTSSVTLSTSTASGDGVDVLATAVPMNLHLNGVGAVNVGRGSLRGIQGPLNIMNGADRGTVLALDDSADTAPEEVTQQGFLPVGPSSGWGEFLITLLDTGQSLAPISYQIAGARSLLLKTSMGNSVIWFHDIRVPFRLIGGPGDNTLAGPLLLNNAWDIKAANAGTLDKTVSFFNMENLMGGPLVDIFRFEPSGSVWSVNGGGAPAGQGDWLDYSGWTAPVTVNLGTGSASAIGGGAPGQVSNIQNVFGSPSGSTLIGNALGNILVGEGGLTTIVGGSGRSVLIGGSGASAVIGGSGGSPSDGDILIAGTTIYDSDATAHVNALMAILTEWQSADSYATRFTMINTGIGMPGGVRLTYGKDVFDNGQVNTLIAQPGLAAVDWFFGNFASGHSTIFNFEPGEHVNNM